MPSEHLFGVNRKRLSLQRGAIICRLKRLYYHNKLCEGSELDDCDDKAFSIHKLWLLSGGRGVFGRHQKGVLTAHNWWSVEYETAASGATQQYKGKIWRSWRSRVVVAQWLEHWWLKPVALGSIPGDYQDFHFFPLLFPDSFRWESFYLVCVKGQLWDL